MILLIQDLEPGWSSMPSTADRREKKRRTGCEVLNSEEHTASSGTMMPDLRIPLVIDLARTFTCWRVFLMILMEIHKPDVELKK